MLISLLLGAVILAASLLALAVFGPGVVVAVAARRWRAAAVMAVPLLLSLPGSLFVVGMARVYRPATLSEPPPLASSYRGESRWLELGEDGRFQAELGEGPVEGDWSERPGPQEGVTATARVVELQADELALQAVLRWDGKLGLRGELLEPE